MFINSIHPTSNKQTFQAKYSTADVVNFVATNEKMRKADCINFIHTVVSVTKDEHKAMMRADNIAYKKQLVRVINHLLSEVPALEKIAKEINTLPPIYKNNIIEKAEALYGNKIEIKKLINHKRK